MFQQTVRMQGTDPTYRNNLGLAYAKNEQYRLALQEFEHSKGRGKGFAYLNHVIARYGLSSQCDQYHVLEKSFPREKEGTSHQSCMDTTNVQTTALSIEKLRTKLLREGDAAQLRAPALDTMDRTILLASEQKKPVFPAELATDERSPNKSGIDISPVAEAEIEISNGNGVNGMAHLVGNFLSKRSFPIKRLTNASRFTFATSTIFYCPGYAHDAHDVESQIPGDQQVDEVKELGRPNIKVRVRLGNDVINKRHFFKQSIMTAEAGFLDRENRTKINTSM
ncbi:MAG: LytR C-terminal domain-containing protein, partial [Desulfoplanes sp.]